MLDVKIIIVYWYHCDNIIERMYSDCYNFQKQPNSISFLQPLSQPDHIQDFSLEPPHLPPYSSNHPDSTSQQDTETFTMEEEDDIESPQIDDGKRTYRDFKLGKKYTPWKISSVLGLVRHTKESNRESRPIKRIKV